MLLLFYLEASFKLPIANFRKCSFVVFPFNVSKKAKSYQNVIFTFYWSTKKTDEVIEIKNYIFQICDERSAVSWLIQLDHSFGRCPFFCQNLTGCFEYEELLSMLAIVIYAQARSAYAKPKTFAKNMSQQIVTHSFHDELGEYYSKSADGEDTQWWMKWVHCNMFFLGNWILFTCLNCE